MAFKQWIVAFGLIAAASPLSASQPEAIPAPAAPPASPNARYCLRIEAVTGTRLERVWCRTRSEWADWDVDVDREWAKEGVRIIG
jgi:hypothetical protein